MNMKKDQSRLHFSHCLNQYHFKQYCHYSGAHYHVKQYYIHGCYVDLVSFVPILPSCILVTVWCFNPFILVVFSLSFIFVFYCNLSGCTSCFHHLYLYLYVCVSLIFAKCFIVWAQQIRFWFWIWTLLYEGFTLVEHSAISVYPEISHMERNTNDILSLLLCYEYLTCI